MRTAKIDPFSWESFQFKAQTLGHGIVVMGLLLLAACGGDDTPPLDSITPSAASTPTFTVTGTSPPGTPTPPPPSPTATRSPTPPPTPTTTATPSTPTATATPSTDTFEVPTATPDQTTPTPTPGSPTPEVQSPTPTQTSAPTPSLAPTPTPTALPSPSPTQVPDTPTEPPTPTRTPFPTDTPGEEVEGDPLLRIESYDPADDFAELFNQGPGDGGDDGGGSDPGDGGEPPPGSERSGTFETPSPSPSPDPCEPPADDPDWVEPLACDPRCQPPPDVDPDNWQPPTDCREECQVPAGIDPEDYEYPRGCEPPPDCTVPEGEDPETYELPEECGPNPCEPPEGEDPDTWEAPAECEPLECGPPPGTDIFEWQPPLACLPEECQPPEGQDPDTWELPEECLFDPCEPPPGAEEGGWNPPRECIPDECFRPGDVSEEDWVAPEGCPDIPEDGGSGGQQIFFEFTTATRAGDIFYLGGQGGLFTAKSRGTGRSPEPIDVQVEMPRVKFISANDTHIAAATEQEIYIFRQEDGLLGDEQFVIRRGSPKGLYPGHIFLTNDYIVIPGFDEGLIIADPLTLAEVGYLREGLVNATGAYVVEDIIWVADGLGGLKGVDFANPGLPRVISEVDLPGVAQDLTFDEERGILYVGLGSAGIAIIDVTEPLVPELLSVLDSRGTAFGVYYESDRLFVAAWGVIEIFNVADPLHPTLHTLEWPTYSAKDIVAKGDEVVVGDWYVASYYRYRTQARSSELYSTTRDLRFSLGEAGDTLTEALTLYNDGARALTIDRFNISPFGSFTVEPDSLTIPPNSRETVEISYTVTNGDESLDAFLGVDSNDPDEGDFNVNLSYGGDRIAVGGDAPDFTLESMAGELHTLSEQEGHVVLLAYFTTW